MKKHPVVYIVQFFEKDLYDRKVVSAIAEAISMAIEAGALRSDQMFKGEQGFYAIIRVSGDLPRAHVYKVLEDKFAFDARICVLGFRSVTTRG